VFETVLLEEPKSEVLGQLQPTQLVDHAISARQLGRCRFGQLIL
jgi:hypothetical protein